MTNIPRWVLSTDHKLYIGSPVWRAKRIPILERAAGHCEKCHRPTKHLQVHHLTYVRSGGAELPEDLLAICRRCHLNEHNLTRGGRKRRKGELPSLWNVPKEERRRRKKERRAGRKKARVKAERRMWAAKIPKPILTREERDRDRQRRYRSAGQKFG